MKGSGKNRFGPRVSGAPHGRGGWRGFTIVELLVAMSITMLMMFLINRLFFDTVNAVGQGMALNHILSDSRTISDQIYDDAEHMVGPSAVTTQDRGFLVIINQVIPNVTIKGEANPRNVRSDQLVFIRDAQGLEPLAPGTKNSFSNGSTAPYARVWYGHLRRTLPDGTDSGVLGVNTAGNLNRVGSDWIIGRQALFLAGTSGVAGSNIFANDPVNIARYNAVVVNSGTTLPVASQVMYMGLSDVANKTLTEVIADVTTGNYNDKAYAHTFGAARLRVNPMPDGTTFESWRIGQMHPYLMEHVSDFVVEFAVDVNKAGGSFPEGEPDIHGGTKNLVWYGLDNLPSAADWGTNYNAAFPATYPGSPYLPIGANEVRWVFRHDFGPYWPYLIRIRYRLHDPKGKFKEQVYSGGAAQAQSGMWFEQIIKVNRD